MSMIAILLICLVVLFAVAAVVGVIVLIVTLIRRKSAPVHRGDPNNPYDDLTPDAPRQKLAEPHHD